MFGIPEPETIVIVEADKCGKYSKLLHNLVGTADDVDSDHVVGPVDGSIRTVIYGERLFNDNPLTSDQKVVFVGDPSFAHDYIEALDAQSTERIEGGGVHILVSGKQASITVDPGPGTREQYWEFLDFARSHGEDLPDLLSDFHEGDAGPKGDPNNPLEAIGGFFMDVGGFINRGVGDLTILATKGAEIEGQKYQFAVKLFYTEKLRSFAEA